MVSLLADSMGLGKTCQTIAALARLWKIDLVEDNILILHY